MQTFLAIMGFCALALIVYALVDAGLDLIRSLWSRHP